METLQTVLMFIIIAAITGFGLFIKNYIGEIPKRVHDRSIEELRNTLEKELSHFEITEQNLYLKKLEVYEMFLESFYNIIRSTKEKEDKGAEIRSEAQEKLNDFLNKSIFYCDEDTYKKVLIYRRFVSSEDMDIKENRTKGIMIVTDIILQMRVSLGYEEELSRDSFLYLILNDWDELREREDYKNALNENFEAFY